MTAAGMDMLAIAGTTACTAAEGPHLRFAIWVQGCTLACPGCCNPEMFVRGRGRMIEIDALDAAIGEAHRRGPIEGITVLGGEPLQQLGPVTALCQAAAARSLGVLVFSGYSHAEARIMPGFERLWLAIDTLVDGRFDAGQRDDSRRFLGSRNQALVHRTARYADPALWDAQMSGGPAVELDIVPGRPVRLVGTPALAARVSRSLGVRPP